METVLEISLPIVFGLFFYLIIDIVSDITSCFRKREWISNVGRTELVRQIIRFTDNILYYKNIKRFPAYSISYYRHKSFAGNYNGNKITIYIWNTNDVESIVRVTLHEICHYIQHQTNMKEYSEYEYYSEIYGYDDNPLEIECRQFADKWTNPCLRYLLSKNLVKQQ